MPNEIPEVVILRLPLYARVLAQLESQGIDVVSSQMLGDLLQATPAQIRKDLSYFGRFGKQGRGYNVHYLQQELRQILGLNRTWIMALVGVGQLGSAILSYGGFQRQGFQIVAAFDADPARTGTTVGGLVIQSVAELQETVRTRGIEIGIVAVPAAHGQEVVDALVACGIKGILNYAPFQVRVPRNVWVRDIDPVVALQSMTYHLKGVYAPPRAMSVAVE
ncbi:MAG: redox-sensing transcriptional repressor Rex [Chloroflexi bacterium]|nr:redox-sensing transcriptional repressor Rex [Chloroflexota bacterium]